MGGGGKVRKIRRKKNKIRDGSTIKTKHTNSRASRLDSESFQEFDRPSRSRRHRPRRERFSSIQIPEPLNRNNSSSRNNFLSHWSRRNDYSGWKRRAGAKRHSEKVNDLSSNPNNSPRKSMQMMQRKSFKNEKSLQKSEILEESEQEREEEILSRGRLPPIQSLSTSNDLKPVRKWMDEARRQEGPGRSSAEREARKAQERNFSMRRRRESLSFSTIAENRRAREIMRKIVEGVGIGVGGGRMDASSVMKRRRRRAEVSLDSSQSSLYDVNAVQEDSESLE